MSPASDPAHDNAAEILNQVELHSLKATPGTIVPFEASEIAWNVSGPAGFALFLDNATVPKIGERVVTPSSTRTFRLRARALGETRELGAVTVTVDAAACRIAPVPLLVVEQKVREGIEEYLFETPGATRRRDDVVTVNTSGIAIKLALKQVVNNFPNPDVDVEARWVFRAVNGELDPDFSQLDVSIRFPWWVWLLPIAYPGLPIAISMAKDSARSKLRKKAAGGAEALEAAVTDPRLRILSAEFTVTNFEMLACPDTSLRKLVPGLAVLHATPQR